MTGLSGSGKTTIAKIVEAELKARGLKIERLDGDVVRQSLTRDLGFSKEDRDMNIERVTFVAKLLSRNGVGVKIRSGDDTKYVGVKTDLTMDLLTENVRPRYTFESGRVKYGPIETDASFLYARRSGNELTYSAANMVKVVYDGQTVFAARPSTYSLQPDDLTTGYGPPKWRYWEDTVDLPK